MIITSTPCTDGVRDELVYPVSNDALAIQSTGNLERRDCMDHTRH